MGTRQPVQEETLPGGAVKLAHEKARQLLS